MTGINWQVGQLVEVECRQWAGINKPGGYGMISKIQFKPDGTVQSLDVKYTVGGCEKGLDPGLVFQHEHLERNSRSRKSRTFLDPAASTRQTFDKHGKEVKKEGKQRHSRTSKRKKDGKSTTAKATSSTTTDSPNKKRTKTTTSKNNKITKHSGTKKEGNDPTKNLEQAQQPVKDNGEPAPAALPQTPVKKQEKQKATKVTPIPAFVITQGGDYLNISPIGGTSPECSIPLPQLRDKPPKEVSCKRHLFDEKVTSQNEQEETKPAIMMTKAQQELERYPEVENQYNDAPSTPMKQNRTSEHLRLLESLPPPPLVTATTKMDRNTEPANNDTSEIKKDIINALSAVHVTSNNVQRDKEEKTKGLKEVYDEEMHKAKLFVHEVIGPRVGPGTSNESNKKEILQKERARNSRYKAFLASFRAIRKSLDDECIEEDAFICELNNNLTDTSTPFTADEIGSHVEGLCQDGKLMKSEGVLYMID